MIQITGLSHLFKWENLHNWWLTKYFFAPLYMVLNKYALGCNKQADMQYSLYLPFYLNINVFKSMYISRSSISAIFEECACASMPKRTPEYDTRGNPR